MKHWLVVALLMLAGCGDKPQITQQQPPPQQIPLYIEVPVARHKVYVVHSGYKISEVEIDHHDYLIFPGNAIIHKVNCSGCYPRKPEKE